jgi:hypothetical protein
MATTNEYMKRWYAKQSPDKKAEISAYVQKQKRRRLERMAGRPAPDVCEICGGTDSKNLSFDHCHRTGQFRGWLCARCNLTLGRVDDDQLLLHKMILYLQGRLK